MAEPIDKDTRGPVNLRIKFRSESLQQFIERYGVDVSRGGIFIRTREPLPVGTRLKLDFQLVDTAPLFQGDGTVVWIREHDASRAGVTPGMGVRFDRLTPESQTTLDTILEEKIRLQQSGVAPGSIAKAGAGMAVRRPSGAFATLEAQTARPSGPPPLPVEVKMDTPIAPSISVQQPMHATPALGARPTLGAGPAMGAAPAAPMPASSSRSGAHPAGAGSNSIFSRPRTTSGMRAVPVPSQLFEAPTAADIDKALSVLEEKGGTPSMPPVPQVIKPAESSMPIGEDDPTRVFDASSEFAASEAITGQGEVLPETGIPIDTDEAGGDGELTERRLVDPTSGQEKKGKADGKPMGIKAEMPPPVPKTGSGQPPATLDAPLSSLVDSGKAPPLKAPPLMTPAAAKAAAEAAKAAAKAAAAVPKRVTTNRAAAGVESGRFRSDTRYKRKRGNGLYWAIAILLLGGGGAFGGFKYMKRQQEKRAAEALAAAAASPPLAAGQEVPQPGAPGAGGAAAPTEAVVPPTEAAKPGGPEEAVAKPEKPTTAEKPAKPEKQDFAKPAEKSARTEDGPSPKPKRKERPVTSETPAKPAEAATDKKPVDETGKTDTSKPAEAAKPADGDKGEKTEKTGEAAKPAETPAAPAAPPVLKITSSPSGADVTIDGVPAGVTPFSSKEVDPGGTHTISLKKDGFEPQERMISGSDWARGKGGAMTLKFNIKMKRAGGEPKPPPAEPADKKNNEVEILTPSEP